MGLSGKGKGMVSVSETDSSSGGLSQPDSGKKGGVSKSFYKRGNSKGNSTKKVVPCLTSDTTRIFPLWLLVTI